MTPVLARLEALRAAAAELGVPPDAIEVVDERDLAAGHAWVAVVTGGRRCTLGLCVRPDGCVQVLYAYAEDVGEPVGRASHGRADSRR